VGGGESGGEVLPLCIGMILSRCIFVSLDLVGGYEGISISTLSTFELPFFLIVAFLVAAAASALARRDGFLFFLVPFFSIFLFFFFSLFFGT